MADPEAAGTDDADLQLWLDELRASAASRARSTTSWLSRLATEDQTVTGLLSDLHDASRPVVVETAAGSRHRGLVRIVGTDVVVVRSDQGADVVVPLVALAAVRGLGRPVTGAARRRRGDARLVTVLAMLAESGARVVARSRSGHLAVRGWLDTVAPQMITLRLEGEGGLVYLPLTSLAEVSVLESG